MAKQNNEFLMKNHKSDTTRYASSLKGNAMISYLYFHGHGRGRTSDHGCGHDHKKILKRHFIIRSGTIM